MTSDTPSNSIPVFGYFCIVQPDGTEKILINCFPEGDQWQFPLKGEVNPSASSTEQVISDLVSSFIEQQNFSNRGELQSSGLAPFEINLVRLGWYVKGCVKFQQAWQPLQGQKYFSTLDCGQPHRITTSSCFRCGKRRPFCGCAS